MSARNRKGTCAYCGRQKKLTVDHVPAKLFLERPFPPNLLTVPACFGCNQSFIADDEYTRTVLATDIRATWNYAAQSNLPAILRSLQRPNARGFAEYISQQSHLMNVLAPSGNPFVTVQIERQRINRSGLHMLRGLYFHETGKRLSGTSAAVRVGSKAGLTAEDSDMLTIARVFHLFPDQRNGAAGTAFSYAAAIGDRRSVWLMLLYDYFFWVGSVDERDATEREADGAKEYESPSRVVFV
ncbi:MAG: hypothetical protein C5B51_01605 [Terriglobia bacterium]|nr:MAG: hypothetical protein C5B51_01605 [Terriglobia bacterium]